MPIKPKGPKTQIRAKKDTNRKEIAELKAKNQELQRTVARLRREVERGEPQDKDGPVGVYNDEIPQKDADGDRCEFCESANLKVFYNLAGKSIVICNDCTKRRFAPPLD